MGVPMSIIWDEVEEIGQRARELGIRSIYADAEEARRAQLRRVEAAAIRRIFADKALSDAQRQALIANPGSWISQGLKA